MSAPRVMSVYYNMLSLNAHIVSMEQECERVKSLSCRVITEPLVDFGEPTS